MKKIGFEILLLLCCFSACQRDVYYEDIQAITDEMWSSSDTLHFQFSITDTLQYYTICMDIRNSIDFETQNLYLFMDSQDPYGTVNRDTLQFLLADAHGEWIGQGSGRLKYHRYLFYPKVRFPYSGTYKFSFVQAMRTKELKGIADFGISVCYFNEDNFRK